VADAEYVLIASDLMKALGVNDFQVRLNNRQILNGFFEYSGIKEKDVRAVFMIIDKKDKISPSEFNKELKSIGLSSEQIKRLSALEKYLEPIKKS